MALATVGRAILRSTLPIQNDAVCLIRLQLHCRRSFSYRSTLLFTRKNLRGNFARDFGSQSCRNLSAVVSKICGMSMMLVPVSMAFVIFGPNEEHKEYKAALEKLKKDNRIVLLLKRAKLAESRQEFDSAQQFYHQALRLLQNYEVQGKWTPAQILQARIYILDAMANLALHRGQYGDAESLFKETIRGLIQSGKDKDDNAIIEISLKLAMIFAVRGQIEEAEAGYHFCVEKQEQKVSEMKEVDQNSMALLGLCVDAYSKFVLLQKKYALAQATLEKALELARKVFGDSHPQVAVLINDIATVASLQDSHELAKSKIVAAIEISQATGGRDLASFQCNLGLVCIHLKQFEEAKQHCQSALKTAKEMGDKEGQERAQACLNALKAI